MARSPDVQQTTSKAASNTSERMDNPLDVSMIQLPGEEENFVPVYDTCDTIRRKIGAFLRKKSVTQTAFLRALATAAGDNRQIQNGQLRRFLMMKGPRSGNTNQVYAKAYIFFEKVRKRDGKGKSDDRLEMERLYPKGMNTTKIRNHAWVPPGRTAGIDKYGVIHVF